MKKLTLILLLNFATGIIIAQEDLSNQLLKYVTTAPDGSIAMTIYDSVSQDTMRLESADTFYKYQILDTRTAEPVFEAENRGKECLIDKTKIANGTYNLKLYTSNFVITSKITVSASRKFRNSINNNHSIAMNDE